MGAHQLDDLGLSVGDVLDALNAPRRLRQCSTPAASAARPAGLRIAPPP
jgi:hypothetical protein